MKPKTNRAGNEYEPKGYDLCQTPAYALTPLLPYLTSYNFIWEPATGGGYLSKALVEAGLFVVETDILTGQNFFELSINSWDVIVTNPPYSGRNKQMWLKRCYEFEKPFALLLPVEFLGTKSGQALFSKYGVEIILLDKRINFKMPNKGWEGQAQFPVAWFTHGLNIGQQLTFAHIERN